MKNAARRLEEAVVRVLQSEFPTLLEEQKEWKTVNASITYDPKGVSLLHQARGSNTSSSSQRRTFKIHGLTIKDRHTKEPVAIEILISENLINHISIPFEKSIDREYDLTSIIFDTIRTEEITLQNPDKEILDRILKDIPNHIKSHYDLDDTHEITLGNKRYYTILDMEDGDYMAVDEEGSVFRLIHDHQEPARMVSKSIQAFDFTGNKSEVSKYFES